ncbi:ddb2 [Acrasis kona]|uniref:Ddb2 n=1 Tax=Acrasis kona TaxID=1008807 RepID=A0AAW2ZA67_9EUKA
MAPKNPVKLYFAKQAKDTLRGLYTAKSIQSEMESYWDAMKEAVKDDHNYVIKYSSSDKKLEKKYIGHINDYLESERALRDAQHIFTKLDKKAISRKRNEAEGKLKMESGVDAVYHKTKFMKKTEEALSKAKERTKKMSSEQRKKAKDMSAFMKNSTYTQNDEDEDFGTHSSEDDDTDIEDGTDEEIVEVEPPKIEKAKDLKSGVALIKLAKEKDQVKKEVSRVQNLRDEFHNNWKQLCDQLEEAQLVISIKEQEIASIRSRMKIYTELGDMCNVIIDDLNQSYYSKDNCEENCESPSQMFAAIRRSIPGSASSAKRVLEYATPSPKSSHKLSPKPSPKHTPTTKGAHVESQGRSPSLIRSPRTPHKSG